MALGSVEGRAGFFERPQRQGRWGVAERGGSSLVARRFGGQSVFARPSFGQLIKLLDTGFQLIQGFVLVFNDPVGHL